MSSGMTADKGRRARLALTFVVTFLSVIILDNPDQDDIL